MSEVKPAFSDDVQFRRYSDTSTQGQQIVFAVRDRDALEAFIGREGKRAMLVLVWLNDDESPEQPQEPSKAKRTDTRGPLCREACDYAKLADFQRFVSGIIGDTCDESTAKEWILAECGGINSRKELDSDQIASELFIERVRVPFFKWQRAQRRVA